MKKLLLFFAVALFVGCVDYTDDFNAIDERLDALELKDIPSIEEQIESINAQLTSLKATDEAIKEQISELEKSDKATAEEISSLKAKDQALEKSINDLQNYVDTQIANAKSEAAAAYATVEQYNTIVAQLNALQSSTNKLGEELTAKINAEVKSLTDKITDLENRLEAVEDKVENLLARIQSVSYIPTYSDGKATLKCTDTDSLVILDFEISPKDAVAELAKVWNSAISVKAVYTQTRAVEFVDMPIIKFEADTANGIISITASGENLSEEFFAGKQEASIALVISDGNNTVTSEYVPMVVEDLTTTPSAQFKGSWTVINTESGEISYQESDVTIDVEFPNVTTAKFNIIFNRIRFAYEMPISLTMKLSGISFSTRISADETYLEYVFEQEGVVPTIGDTPYEQYKFKSLKGYIGLDVEIEFEFENRSYTAVFTTKK